MSRQMTVWFYQGIIWIVTRLWDQNSGHWSTSVIFQSRIGLLAGGSATGIIVDKDSTFKCNQHPG